MTDTVNHPEHYKTGKYECIKVMQEIFGEDAVRNFCKLNAFKYLWRSDRKNGKEDLLKAKWYLDTYLLSEDLNPYDPEDDNNDETPDFSDGISNIFDGLGDVFSKTWENIKDFANPDGDHRKRIERFKELKEEGYSEDVAFYFAAFKDLPEDKDE